MLQLDASPRVRVWTTAFSLTVPKAALLEVSTKLLTVASFDATLAVEGKQVCVCLCVYLCFKHCKLAHH